MRSFLTYFAIGFLATIAIMGVIELVANMPVEDAEIAPSVVMVMNTSRTGGGTGFYAFKANKQKVIVTNAHVCELGTNGYVAVEDDNGLRSLNKIITSDSIRDLCLVETTRGKTLALAAEGPKRFEIVRSIGHASLKDTSSTQGQFIGYRLEKFLEAQKAGGCAEGATPVTIETMFGPIDACEKQEQLGFTTIYSGPGASGSPVINQAGEVVGVLNSGDGLKRAQFVPLSYLKEILGK
jgi:hypothetical protein